MKVYKYVPTLSVLEYKLLCIIEENSKLKGYQIEVQYNKATGEKISHGSLFTTLRRLEEAKFIKKSKVTKKEEDQRERTFARTRKGTNEAHRNRYVYADLAKFEAPPA